MNVGKLLGIIKENGDTQTTLANKIGLTRGRLNAKIHQRNNASFTQPEILAIKNRYLLSSEQIDEIFFTQQVS